MAYADLLDSEGITSQYIAIINPRRIVAGWVSLGGNSYEAPFDFGDVTFLSIDGVSKSLASSIALTDGDWFYDDSTEKVLYDDGGATDPTAGTVVCAYNIYVGTFDAHYFSDPDNIASKVVYYDPFLIKAPVIKTSSKNYLFGFLPVQSSSMKLANVDSFWAKHVYDSSFNQATVVLYHYLDSLEPANVKKVFSGYCGEITYASKTVDIKVFDNNKIYDQAFRHLNGKSFYATSDFPDLNPNFLGSPIRGAWGLVEGFVPVNIEYFDGNPTSLENRFYICINYGDGIDEVSSAVLGAPASTATRIYLASADGFNIGDSVWVNNVAPDEFTFVTAVNRIGTNYIDVSPSMSNIPIATSTVTRSWVGNITAIIDGTEYRPRFGRDYISYKDVSNNVAGFELLSTAGTNLGMPRYFSHLDDISCRLYGANHAVTLGGLPFGADSTETANLTAPIPIIFDLLTRHLGLSEALIDTVGLAALNGLITSQYGFSVPRLSAEQMPRYSDIFSDMAASELLRFLIDDDQLLSIARTQPVGAFDKETGDDEIIEGSLSYRFNYRDMISDAIVRYRQSERTAFNSNAKARTVTGVSTNATYLHEVERQRTFDSMHIFESDAQSLADRIIAILGDRGGVARIDLKNRFFNTEIMNTIQVSIDNLPGFEFQSGIENSRSFRVLGIEKGLDRIRLELDDQKGIEDNTGDF